MYFFTVLAIVCVPLYVCHCMCATACVTRVCRFAGDILAVDYVSTMKEATVIYLNNYDGRFETIVNGTTLQSQLNLAFLKFAQPGTRVVSLSSLALDAEVWENRCIRSCRMAVSWRDDRIPVYIYTRRQPCDETHGDGTRRGRQRLTRAAFSTDDDDTESEDEGGYVHHMGNN